MLITRRGLTSLLALCIPQLRGGARVRRRHLMTAILNTRRVLSRFCLHSHRDEVLGGPRWSITSEGSSCSPVFGPGSSSRALTNCLWMASGEKKGPFKPPLSLSADKCSSAASPRHMPPFHLLLRSIRWPALHSRMAHHELLYLHSCWKPSVTQARTHVHACDLHPSWQMCWFFFVALAPPLWLWTAKAFVFFPSRRKK